MGRARAQRGAAGQGGQLQAGLGREGHDHGHVVVAAPELAQQGAEGRAPGIELPCLVDDALPGQSAGHTRGACFSGTRKSILAPGIAAADGRQQGHVEQQVAQVPGVDAQDAGIVGQGAGQGEGRRLALAEEGPHQRC